MYPATYFNLFPPFPLVEQVFIAISFHAEFEHRLQKVISPAIVKAGLKPFVVNSPRISDSIITDISKGIGTSRLIFADVSQMQTTGLRNPNVMYEVGIAHALRQPQEVILFRSDDGPLPFDMASIRVNRYAPEADPVGARDQVEAAIRDSLSEIDITKSLAVSRAATSLDGVTLNILRRAAQGPIVHPEMRTMGQVLGNLEVIRATVRLLELGALATEYTRITPELALSLNPDQTLPQQYRITPLGNAIVFEIIQRMGLGELIADPAIAERLRQMGEL